MGIVGMATAYFLGKAGVKSLVVERDAVGSHASGFAYGGLSPLSGTGIPGALAEVAQEGMRLHREFAQSLAEETRINIEFRVRPSLALAFTEAEVQRLQAVLPWQQQQPGYTVRWLDAAEARKIEPRISADSRGAVFIDGTADVEPYRLVLALTRAAENLGASIRHGRVTGLRRQAGQVTGVRLETWGDCLPHRGAGHGALEWRNFDMARHADGSATAQGADSPAARPRGSRGLLGRLGTQLRHHQARWPAVGRND